MQILLFRADDAFLRTLTPNIEHLFPDCPKRITVCSNKSVFRISIFFSVAIGRARDRGLLEMRVPFRDYDYGDFYPKDLLEECDYEDILSPAETAFLARTKDVAERQLGRNDVVYEDAFALDEDDDFDESDDSDSDRENVQ